MIHIKLGNIALCISSSSSSIGLSEGCLGWILGGNGDVVSISTPHYDVSLLEHNYTLFNSNTSIIGQQHDEEEQHSQHQKKTCNWNYENGFLRTSITSTNDNEDEDENVSSTTDLCLGLSSGVTYLKEKSCSPYELVLQDCPTTITKTTTTSTTTDDDDETMTLVDTTRHMRFLVTNDGRIQSLAPVLDCYGEDVMITNPYCLTINNNNSNKAYLMPCNDDEEAEEEEEEEEKENIGTKILMQQQQYFEVYGKSKPFLMSLQSRWGYKDVVELAYHIGVDTADNNDNRLKNDVVAAANAASAASAASIEITMPLPVDGLISPLAELTDMLVDVLKPFNNNETSGIISFVPSDYDGVYGPMAASLMMSTTMTTTTTNEEIIVAETTFDVANDKNHVKCGTSSGLSSGSMIIDQFTAFVTIIGGFIGAFILSVLVEKCFYSKTRANSTTTTNDDDEKTECMMMDEDDLELDSSNVEADDDLNENNSHPTTNRNILTNKEVHQASSSVDEETADDESSSNNEGDSTTARDDSDDDNDYVENNTDTTVINFPSV
jgi:hypothetical protein